MDGLFRLHIGFVGLLGQLLEAEVAGIGLAVRIAVRLHRQAARGLQHGGGAVAEHGIQSLGQGVLIGDAAVVVDDDPFDLGDGGIGGFQIDGLHVHQAALDEDDEHVAPGVFGAGGVPQGEVLGDLGVLVDQGLHLGGAVDDPVLGHLVQHQVAVILAVVAGHEDGGQVVLARGRVGDGDDELGVLLARQLHDVVLGSHGAFLHAVDLVGDVPAVLALVEGDHVGHVVLGVDVGLDGEHVLRVADVGLQALGHLMEIPEQLGIDLLQGQGDGVVAVHDVVVHAAVIGVHHHLHRVADIVGAVAVVGLGIGVVSGGGVGVEDPEQALVGDHDVGVVVVGQERRDLLHAVFDVAVDDDAGIPGDIGGDQDLDVPFTQGEQAAVQQVQRDAGSAGIFGVDVAGVAGIVEFLLVGVHDGIGVGILAEVDGGVGHLDLFHLGDGRDGIDEHIRLAGGGDLVHPGQGDAVAVGVFQVGVEPGIGDGGLVQLTGGEVGLGVFAVYHIAVHVRVVEVVVQTDGLGLVVVFQHRRVVVDADVGDGLGIGQDIVHPQPVADVVIVGGYVVQIVGVAGEIDVAL